MTIGRRKIIYGVGINDADYQVYKCRRVDGKMVVDWVCPYYSRWLDMIRRCYSKRQKAKQKSYEHCTTSEEWKTFSNFKAWMEKQDWAGKELDKDLRILGNTIYSESTCIFLPKTLNNLFKSSKINPDLPAGIFICNGKPHVEHCYMEDGKLKRKRKTLKTFSDCLLWWSIAKKERVESLLRKGEINRELHNICINTIDDRYLHYINLQEVKDA